MILTVTQVINNMVAYIQNVIPGLSLLEGTVARDVVIESPAQEFGRVWTELGRVEAMQTMTDPTAFINNELDNLASSFGLTRKPGTAALGSVTFSLANFSPSSSNITISAGTEISTQSSLTNNTVVTFTTTSTVTFVAANASTFYNPQNGDYEITVPIQATTAGTQGNVAAGTINVLVTSLPNNITVSNSNATFGGSAAESDAALLTRIQLKLAGTAMGTPSGILSFVNASPYVIASLLVGPTDPLLVRSSYGNAADVYIIGDLPTPVVETQTFTAGIATYVLQQQPVEAGSVNQIIAGTVGGLSFNFVEGTNFVVNQDNTTSAGGSVNAQTSVTFLGSPFPDANTGITIDYSVNNLIVDLQTSINSDTNHIVGTDILIREAIQVLVDVSAFITVFPGYTKANVVAAAVTNVDNLLNSSTLGSSISESDIIATIQETPGVNAVSIPIFISISTPTVPALTPVVNLVTAENQYLRPNPAPNSISIT
jgi:uncharacterized phage protein gp47/JayE